VMMMLRVCLCVFVNRELEDRVRALQTGAETQKNTMATVERCVFVNVAV